MTLRHFKFTVFGFAGEPVDFRVWEERGDQIRVNYADRPEYGTWMPAESLPHFIADLRGEMTPKVKRAYPTKHPTINALIEGRGKLLGKGDDGVVWRVGDEIVKASTTVPYQPMNSGHRTPKEAKQMLRRAGAIVRELQRAGVPGLLPFEQIEVADKLFEVKPLLEDPPKKLSKEQLDDIAHTVGLIHERGYVLADRIDEAVGLDAYGRPWFFDLGKIQKGKRSENVVWDDFEDERSTIARMYHESGHPFVPPMPMLEPVWTYATEERPAWAYPKVTDERLEEFERLADAAIAAGLPMAKRDAERTYKAMLEARR